jgi:hypothetical protein
MLGYLFLPGLLFQCPDVVVVVWRWYGGRQLGPKRWKIISQVAGEALSQLPIV